MSLADSRKTLERYCSGWDDLEPAVKWSEDLRSPDFQAVSFVSGTLGILWKDSAEFFALGSISRGTPTRRWDIVFSYSEDRHFAFYPQANVLAIVEKAGLT